MSNKATGTPRFVATNYGMLGSRPIEWSAPLLAFENPQFHAGRNLSVRRGGKWYPLNGQSVALIGTKSDDVITLVEIRTQWRYFKDILAEDLKYEHDPNCRTYDGLLAEMKRIYGDGFDENETVTLIWFDMERTHEID